MNRINYFLKLILGLTLILVPLILAIIILVVSLTSSTMGLKIDYLAMFFGRGFEGGSSMAPIFYGLLAVAGTLLLNNLKKQ